MAQSHPDLTALVGSRICHDLISPLGAISNGLELLAMSAELNGPEMNLIAESVDNANARIRFFRVAFGAARPGQTIAAAEVRKILADMTMNTRLTIDWRVSDPLERGRVKLAFLLILVFETAMPRGGHVTIEADEQGWTVSGRAERLAIDPELWHRLSRPVDARGLEPSQVHFALAAEAAEALGRRLVLDSGADSARVRF